YDVDLALTKMADPTNESGCVIETREDVSAWLSQRAADPECKIVFFTAAIASEKGSILVDDRPEPRLGPSAGDDLLARQKAESEGCKGGEGGNGGDAGDVLVFVAFKAPAGASADEQSRAGMRMLETTAASLVLANDVRTRRNMIVVPGGVRYYETFDRE